MSFLFLFYVNIFYNLEICQENNLGRLEFVRYFAKTPQKRQKKALQIVKTEENKRAMRINFTDKFSVYFIDYLSKISY